MGKKQEETAIAKRIILAVQGRYGLDCLAWINRTGSAKSHDGKRFIPFGFEGSPDILACIHGLFIGIEVKTATGAQEESQVVFQREFERAGGVYILARTPAEVLAAIANVIGCRPGQSSAASARP